MTSKPESSRGPRVLLAALALAAIAGLFYFSRSEPAAPSPIAAAPSTTGTTPIAKPMGVVPVAPTGSVGKVTKPEAPEKSASVEQAKQALAEYLVFSEYPAWSRPADDSQRHLWEWNKLPAVGQAFGRDAKGNPLSGELVLDRMFAAAGEPITATLTLWRGAYESTTKEPFDAKINAAIETWQQATAGVAGAPVPSGVPNGTPIEGYAPVESVAFKSVAGGPGHRYVATFTPSSVSSLKAQVDARLIVKVDPGEHEFPFSQPFRYSSVNPVEVLDRHTEAIVKGSLEVTLALDVKKLGPVMVQATLFDATGTTAIAVYDDYYRPAQLGPQEVKLTFFGRTITQKGLDGPYSIRAVHGYVRLDDAEPPEVFWKTEKTFTTAAFKATDFSSAEWDSPEKQDKIHQYKQVIDGFEKGAL